MRPKLPFPGRAAAQGEQKAWSRRGQRAPSRQGGHGRGPGQRDPTRSAAGKARRQQREAGARPAAPASTAQLPGSRWARGPGQARASPAGGVLRPSRD